MMDYKVFLFKIKIYLIWIISCSWLTNSEFWLQSISSLDSFSLSLNTPQKSNRSAIWNAYKFLATSLPSAKKFNSSSTQELNCFGGIGSGACVFNYFENFLVLFVKHPSADFKANSYVVPCVRENESETYKTNYEEFYYAQE